MMSHAIYRVTAFNVVGRYTLEVSFDDGATRTIDFLPVLKGELYGALKDQRVFEAVRIDSDAHTLVWPNGADFDPATLHDWPEVGDDFERMADRWTTTGSGEAR